MKNYNHLSATSKSVNSINETPNLGRHSPRKPATRLRVEYADETICERTAVATLIKTFEKVAEKVGFESILKLKLRRRGQNGSSCLLFEKELPEGQLEADYRKPEFARGYWMRTKSATDEKAIQLGDLKTLLNLQMTITKIV